MRHSPFQLIRADGLGGCSLCGLPAAFVLDPGGAPICALFRHDLRSYPDVARPGGALHVRAERCTSGRSVARPGDSSPSSMNADARSSAPGGDAG